MIKIKPRINDNITNHINSQVEYIWYNAISVLIYSNIVGSLIDIKKSGFKKHHRWFDFILK